MSERSCEAQGLLDAVCEWRMGGCVGVVVVNCGDFGDGYGYGDGARRSGVGAPQAKQPLLRSQQTMACRERGQHGDGV